MAIDTRVLLRPASLLLFLSLVAWPGSDALSEGWRHYGATTASTKYSSLDQIHAGNLDKVEVAWRWRSPTSDLTGGLFKWIHESTPIEVGGVLFASTPTSHAVAIDAVTGETIWVHDPGSYEAKTAAHGLLIHRGVSYWADGEDRRILYGTSHGYLVALNAATGEPVPSFGDGGRVDLTQGLRRPVERAHYSVSSPPVIVGDVVVIGSSITDPFPTSGRPPGDVRGFDVRTGEQLWTFHTIPQAGEHGSETWEDGSWRTTGNANVWTLMSADPELGYVYLPTSTPTNDWYGGHRLGDNLFAESLVCLDAKTGKRVWHFQMVHHGLWDYDLPAAPNLVDITVDGRPIKAVAQVSKQGFVYVFDRATGEPVWPIEERPVPASDVPGERAAETQPYPTHPPPFERQTIHDDDLIDFTPALRQEAVDTLAGLVRGHLFVPPAADGYVQIPGALGGANWTGAAFDPETHRLFVPSITLPGVTSLVPPDPEQSDYRLVHQHIGWKWLSNGLPITKPPYARVTAYDLDTGDIVWQSPLGEGPRNHPDLKHLNLPRLGWPQRGAPLLTKSLLFVTQEAKVWHEVMALISGTMDAEMLEAMTIAYPLLHVYDKATGKLLREIKLPANATGAPMTYMANGKQFIVMPTGGTTVGSEFIGLALGGDEL